VAVRDDSDEIVATMLAQLLRRAGHSAKAMRFGNLDRVITEVLDARPELVCLSALPPYAMTYARTMYDALRARQPDLDIVIGLWNHSGDLAKAARVITGDEGKPICVTLAEAVERVGLRDPDAKPAEKPAEKTDAAVAEARV
jgi:hypothetical protein